MDTSQNQCLYLYDTLTLIGTSCEINLFFWDGVMFSYFYQKRIRNDVPAVINIVSPRRAKIVIFSEDKLSLQNCRYYWNGLSLTAADKKQIIFIDADGVNTLSAMRN